jgi:hypothetical protein
VPRRRENPLLLLISPRPAGVLTSLSTHTLLFIQYLVVNIDLYEKSSGEPLPLLELGQSIRADPRCMPVLAEATPGWLDEAARVNDFARVLAKPGTISHGPKQMMAEQWSRHLFGLSSHSPSDVSLTQYHDQARPTSALASRPRAFASCSRRPTFVWFCQMAWQTLCKIMLHLDGLSSVPTTIPRAAERGGSGNHRPCAPRISSIVASRG